MFKKLKRYLARKLLPYAEITPQKYEVTNLNVETLRAEIMINPDGIPRDILSENVIRRELARKLNDELINRIKFEKCEDMWPVRYQATLRIVRD